MSVRWSFYSKDDLFLQEDESSKSMQVGPQFVTRSPEKQNDHASHMTYNV
jgi:hypothetical protein